MRHGDLLAENHHFPYRTQVSQYPRSEKFF